MSDEQEVIPLDKLARVYRKIYVKAQALARELEALEDKKDLIKNAMKDQMRELGLESVRTEGGTILLSKKKRYYTDDWDSFKTFMLDNDALDLVEKRISQSNMAMFLEDNPGKVPAGLNSITEVSVTVRKPTK